MPDATQSRHCAVLRRYLKSLPDNAADKRSGNTLQARAAAHGVGVQKLRTFRDGRDDALGKSLVKTWVKLLGNDSDIEPAGGDDPLDRPWFNTLMARDTSRLARYDQYETIDNTRPEAASALDCWADIVATGSVGEDRYRGSFEPEYTGDLQRAKKLMREAAGDVNGRLLPPDQLLMLARDMARYGDQLNMEVVQAWNGSFTAAGRTY